jgi:hypothetical protein
VFSQFAQVLDDFKHYCENDSDHLNKLQFHVIDGEKYHSLTTAADIFNFKARKNNAKIHVLLLDKQRADGFDGLQDVECMIIMEPCTTDSMKRQLIARVVRQRAQSKSRVVKVHEYVCVPGALNLKKWMASKSDWWQHDRRVAPWVFEPLLSQARTPDQIVAGSQMVSGVMEDLCKEGKEEYVKGFEKKLMQNPPSLKSMKQSLFGKSNVEELNEIKEVLGRENATKGEKDKQKLRMWNQWQDVRNTYLSS